MLLDHLYISNRKHIDYHIVDYHIVGCHTVSCRIISCRIASCHIIDYHIDQLQFHFRNYNHNLRFAAGRCTRHNYIVDLCYCFNPFLSFFRNKILIISF